MIVLKTVKLPEESVNAVVPFLLSVDWALGRCRSTTNVASDMLVAVLLDKITPEKPENPWPRSEIGPTPTSLEIAGSVLDGDPRWRYKGGGTWAW